MLTVHHLGISQSDRIVWLCEELDVPYELVRYDRDPITRMAPASYKALHPFGTAPVIEDDGLVLGESGAIIEYIIAKHGGGRLAVSKDAANFADYLYWFHFANGSMMPSAMAELIAGMAPATGENAITDMVKIRTDRAFALVDQRLGEADYLAGAEFTAADIIMMFPLTTMRVFVPRDLTPYPNIVAYLQRIAARPAYRRAMEKADPGFAPPLT